MTTRYLVDRAEGNTVAAAGLACRGGSVIGGREVIHKLHSMCLHLYSLVLYILGAKWHVCVLRAYNLGADCAAVPLVGICRVVACVYSTMIVAVQ